MSIAARGAWALRYKDKVAALSGRCFEDNADDALYFESLR